jgi:hypothetical protein
LAQQVWLPTQRAPPAQEHMPPMQLSPVPQRLPQKPQLCASVCGSTQPTAVVPPPQQIWPLVHALVPHRHCPPLQVSPALQAWPHAPQLAGSVWVFLQPVEQQASVPVQATPLQRHEPLVQVSGAVQAWPHWPQFALSLVRLTQVVLLQQVLGAGQGPLPQAQPDGAQPTVGQQATPAVHAAPPLQVHAPLVQASPGLHAWPQPPQLNGSFWKSKQPIDAQHVWLVEQAEPPAQRHSAPEQVSLAAQAIAQPPQLAGSLSTGAQLWSQHCSLAMHTSVPQRWFAIGICAEALGPNCAEIMWVSPIIDELAMARAVITSGGDGSVTGGKSVKVKVGVNT